ncbi:NAD(P)/FAD-dependent oxidoreductase [Gordonia sp. TBRC 11910]|uniref:NAD(P)/FAD-dependent oxidoreductase n=1 Tax=Gordonia asplenii TaxID=2725283 RepID=A0A848L382_9ACTN|nr:NAD(P)/FAD-dependent oxidoreductase [Gordonia asplenii]NMO03505.1 NAD(P)/FAD-dependent oxidoreductase [Gordonia asplenii]
MSTSAPSTDKHPITEEYDLVVIGAGISGIGAVQYFREAFPNRRIIVLEGRSNIGGTWDLFRYPGIRSDSDLHTFGYEFKPWEDRSAIADAPLIRNYLRDTVDEFDLTGLIALRHRVARASWSSTDARWTLHVEVVDADGAVVATKCISTNWIFAGTGYYRYDEGFTPHFDGREDFAGDIIHPQHWPEDYDYSGKKVVVIGSGATAITLVPAMLNGPGAAAHVTMLQRTPTYVLPFPRVDTLALKLTKVFGVRRGYALTRFKNVWMDRGIVKGLRTFPRAGRRLIRSVNKKALPAGYDVDTHFNPPYDPWDQRLCMAPDGDFFDVLGTGAASVVTDRIVRFTETGILLESGEHLDADVIVTATGLVMRMLGGIDIVVDDEPVDITKSVVYRGTLLSGVPNLAMAVGYTTSSWTLKIGMLCRYVVGLVKHMDEHGYDTARVEPDPAMALRPIMDLSSGYALRARATIPKQGEGPWKMSMSYPEDAKRLRGPLLDAANLKLSSSAVRASEVAHV